MTAFDYRVFGSVTITYNQEETQVTGSSAFCLLLTHREKLICKSNCFLITNITLHYINKFLAPGDEGHMALK